VEQFEIFVDQISRGGILVYNEEDLEVKRVAEAATKPTRKLAYNSNYKVENGTTLLETPEGDAYRSFGAHNLNNLAGAKWIYKTWVLMKTISMKLLLKGLQSD
jgi:UDP-N-acetylmuramate: L-alanyl-gamma-D-glutamyl-meso-diaminopimelate ligase